MIVFDVGANNGAPFINGIDTVYAFEPNKRLYDNLVQQCGKNYHPYNLAVSNYNGTSTFYIDDLDDAGCSSLKEFSDNLCNTWPGRSDFAVTSTSEVSVIRLDTFIEQNSITKIDILHIDAQGCDYEVIESLGKYFHIVDFIECEATNKNPLYKGVSSKDDIISICQSNGFKLVSITDNDQFKNEQNLRFINVNSNISTQ